jgi:hypothetical protein
MGLKITADALRQKRERPGCAKRQPRVSRFAEWPCSTAGLCARFTLQAAAALAWRQINERRADEEIPSIKVMTVLRRPRPSEPQRRANFSRWAPAHFFPEGRDPGRFS